MTGLGRKDDGSFERFARGALARLLRTAWLLTGDTSRAEDAVQETLVRLYVVCPKVSLDEPDAYCHRILRNVVVSTWRRDRRLVLVDEVRDDVDGHRATDTSGARLDLVRALQELPSREREVVVLRHYADLSERTVAELLGVSIGTVKSSSSRGLERLRTLISDKGDAHVQ